jgi:hypothetical protein
MNDRFSFLPFKAGFPGVSFLRFPHHYRLLAKVTMRFTSRHEGMLQRRQIKHSRHGQYTKMPPP